MQTPRALVWIAACLATGTLFFAANPASATQVNVYCEGESWTDPNSGNGWARGGGWSSCKSVGTNGYCESYDYYYYDTQGGSVSQQDSDSSCTTDTLAIS